MKLVRVAVPACVALVVGACNGAIALGPTPADAGIIIYIHANYVGTSQQMAVDVADLGDVEGPCVKGNDESATARWDDCISSVRVMPGWRATLYEDDHFKGRSVTITSDAPDLTQVPGPCSRGFNDCVSSIRVSHQ
jgi:hypothetical protein